MYGYRFRPGAGADGELVGGNQPPGSNIVGEDAGAIAAHFRDAAVGVVVVHKPVIIAYDFEAGGAISQAPMPRCLSHRVAMSCGVSESWASGSGRIMKSFWVP